MENKIWNKLLPHISQSLDNHRYETWFKPLVPVPSSNENCLILQTRDKFSADFLDRHFKQLLFSISQKVTPSVKEIRFISPQMDSSSVPGASTYVMHDTSQPLTTIPLNPQYTFDFFVVGQNNEFAKSVSLAVAEAPGHTKFNPLLIYGGVGLGKTHLLHSIANHIIKNIPDISVVYITAEEFYLSFIEAIKNNDKKSFSDRFRKSDVLLVDDIQFLEGKESTQEEFFYIFNSLYQNNKQIILSSDIPPSSIIGLQDRLVSRFQWGLCVDIQPPDLETRVAIIKKKADRDNLNIDEDILYFIAENVSSNIREIEGVIIKLLAFSSITKTDISLDIVKGLLKETIKRERSKISIDEIIERVAGYYKIPSNTIREKNRRKEVSQCRQIAMFLAKTITNHSLKSIGLHFGGRDHSTVIHAIQQIENLQEFDENIRNDINYIVSTF